MDGTIESKVSLLTLYSRLLQFWTASLLSQSPIPAGDEQATRDLITHVGTLALVILQSSLSTSICSVVLDFYETAVSLAMQPSLISVIRITTPPAEIVYTLYFTSSLSTVSRLCGILALYKQAFELKRAQKSAQPVLSYPMEYLNHFNGFLMDICNCIWRSRAFNISDPNATGCLLSESLNTGLTQYVAGLDTSISLPALFSLSSSPVLCLLAISYLREIEDKEEDTIVIRHGGPVTVESLRQLEKDGGLNMTWADYRLGVLRYLERKGAPGVGELMYNTMKILMPAKQTLA